MVVDPFQFNRAKPAPEKWPEKRPESVELPPRFHAFVFAMDLWKEYSDKNATTPAVLQLRPVLV